jgi:hypothetical protein
MPLWSNTSRAHHTPRPGRDRAAASAETAGAVADELEEASWKRWCRSPGDQPVAPDGRRGVGNPHERRLFEAGGGKPASDRRGEVGDESMSRPDRRATRREHHRESPDDPFHVVVHDVAEDAADEHELQLVERPEAVRVAGVRSRERHVPKRQLADPTPSLFDEPLVELDQPRVDVGTSWVALEHAEKVASVTGTEAEHLDLALRRVVEALPDEVLDGNEASAERRASVLVRQVPLLPVRAVRRAQVLLFDERMLARDERSELTRPCSPRGARPEAR